jgi:hypothetical protein
MKISRRILLVFIGLAAVLLAACAPTITVSNNTAVPVRVMVMPPGGSRQVVSISANESIGVEYAEKGFYTAVVIKDQQWIEYTKQKRDYLTQRLQNPQNLSQEEVKEITQQLKEIQKQISAFESSPEPGSACSSKVDPEADTSGLVNISQGADGALLAVCQ